MPGVSVFNDRFMIMVFQTSSSVMMSMWLIQVLYWLEISDVKKAMRKTGKKKTTVSANLSAFLLFCAAIYPVLTIGARLVYEINHKPMFLFINYGTNAFATLTLCLSTYWYARKLLILLRATSSIGSEDLKFQENRGMKLSKAKQATLDRIISFTLVIQHFCIAMMIGFIVLAAAAFIPSAFLLPWHWYGWSLCHRIIEVYINCYLITKMLDKKKDRLKNGLITALVYKCLYKKEYKGKERKVMPTTDVAQSAVETDKYQTQQSVADTQHGGTQLKHAQSGGGTDYDGGDDSAYSRGMDTSAVGTSAHAASTALGGRKGTSGGTGSITTRGETSFNTTKGIKTSGLTETNASSGQPAGFSSVADSRGDTAVSTVETSTASTVATCT